MIEAVALFVAGVWAGGINSVVGSGSLVTFPTLLLFGYPPLTANVSNNIGMVAGGVGGIYGYRRELAPNRSILKRLAPASCAGALVGAVLLLVLPAETFQAVVPALIALGMLMVVVGPAIQRRTAAAKHEGSSTSFSRILLTVGIFLLGVYGGYFGAAQGILLVGLMGMILSDGIQRLTAIKNVLATLVNVVAALAFMAIATHHIDWSLVALISCGTLLGGYLGARFGRRLPPAALRVIILVIGVVALVKLLVFD